jgi:hypothetical protein
MLRKMAEFSVVVSSVLAIGLGVVPAESVGSASPTAIGPGYRLVGSDGGVFSFNAQYYGAPAGHCSTSPQGEWTACATAMATTSNGGGYLVVGPDGNTPYAYGNAPSSGYSCTNPYDIPFGWVGSVLTSSGKGFWLANVDGGIIACGNATSYGDILNLVHSFPTVGIAETGDAKGYWLATSDGGVFAFGDAKFYGSMAGIHLQQPIVGIASTPDGRGYWLVASDGGVFAFGDAVFAGSMGGKHLDAPMAGIAANPDGEGYWTVANDGGVFAFGGAPFEGSMGGKRLAAPIVGISASPA